MVHPTADSGRQTDLGNTNAKVSTSGSGLPPARDLLEQVAGAIEDYANALERRRRREGPASSVSEDVLERFRTSAAQLRRIAETRGSVSLAELLFEDFYGRKFDPATMVIVRDRPKTPSGDRTIKPGKTDISMVPQLDFTEAQRSAKETRLRNYLQTWARSMMKATPVRSWMDRVEKHLQELRRGGVEVSAEVESDLRTWIFEEAKARGLSEDVLRQWRKWLGADDATITVPINVIIAWQETTRMTPADADKLFVEVNRIFSAGKIVFKPSIHLNTPKENIPIFGGDTWNHPGPYSGGNFRPGCEMIQWANAQRGNYVVFAAHITGKGHGVTNFGAYEGEARPYSIVCFVEIGQPVETLAHELAHLLGLDDTSEWGNLMSSGEVATRFQNRTITRSQFRLMRARAAGFAERTATNP